MSPIRKQIEVLLLVAIYCSAIFASGKSSIAINYTKGPFSQDEIHFVSVAKAIQLHTSLPENSPAKYTELAGAKYPNHFGTFSLALLSTGSLIISSFTQYVRYLRTTLICEQKSDSLFPFHDHW